MDANTNLKRRKFLISAGLGGAGIAAAVVAGKAVIGQRAANSGGRESSTGYRPTEHIQNYYRTTRI